MPVNVSTPIWQCTVCGTTFGDRHDTAATCEAAPVPNELPTGTPVLMHRNGQFQLVPLTPTGKITTTLTQWSPIPGHHRTYTTTPPTGTGTVISDAELHPGIPGHLQVWQRTHGEPPTYHHQRRTLPGRQGGTLAAALGAAHPHSPAATGQRSDAFADYNSTARLVNPVTAPVRAIFDALDVHVLPRHNSYADRGVHLSYELARAGGQAHRANLVLDTTDPDARARTIWDLTQRWFAGEPVTPPVPLLTARSTRTASTLTKGLRALVDATGVPWPARTNATEYANLLVKETLMTTTRANLSLFGTTPVIAIGGVKGGVGKSTVAAALATALAGGRRVLLLDLDIAGPSQHLLWNLGPARVSPDNLRLTPEPTTVNNLTVFSCGQLADALPRYVTDDDITMWLDFISATLDTTNIDLIILDLPAGTGTTDALVTGDGHSIPLSTLVHVTTGHPLAVADLERGLHHDLHAKHTDIVVENLSNIRGTTPNGDVTHVRMAGHDVDVEAFATTHRLTYGGSLPWADTPTDLANTPELAALAQQVADTLR